MSNKVSLKDNCVDSGPNLVNLKYSTVQDFANSYSVISGGRASEGIQDFI